MLVQDEAPPVVQDILRHCRMRTVSIPSSTFFLDFNLSSGNDSTPGEVVPYPFAKSFEEARCEPFVIFQTSGSTGIPKPIVMAHGTFTAIDTHQMIPELGGKVTSSDFIHGSRWFNGFPHYHTGCYLYLLGYGIFNNIVTVLAPPKPLTACLINLIQIQGKCTGLILPPSLLEDLSSDSNFLSDLGKLDYVAYSGGPLARSVGDQIASLTKLFNWFGSTEAGMYPTVIHDEGWEYVEFSSFLGHSFRPVGDNLFEFVLVRNGGYDLLQGVFCTYPDLNEFSTKELYSPHALLPGLWRNQGRLDDIIAFSNAEKFNPIDMENSVCSHPAVKAAMVAGHGRFQASLLIEPVTQPEGKESEASLLEDIWPTIQEANRSCVAQGRVEKDLVMFTKTDKPLARTEKGTIRKRFTISEYEKEIDELYAGLEGGLQNMVLLNNRPESERASREESFEDFLKHIFSERAGKEMNDGDDLWALGLDSLHVLALSKEINNYLVKSGRIASPIVTKGMLYSCSTMAELRKQLLTIRISSNEDDCPKI